MKGFRSAPHHWTSNALVGRVLLVMLAVALTLLATAYQASAAPEHAFILTTDYGSAAYYSTIEIPPPRMADVSIEPVSTDPIAHYDPAEDMVFVINRFLADNIQIVDPNQDFATVGQYSVGNGANPHDIRLASSQKAYVSRFEWTTLLIVHPYSGDSLGTIDLSPFADSDGIPEMDRMEIVENRLFVTLNCIDHMTWLPNGEGKVAVIDTDADTLVDCDPGTPGVQPIPLGLPNPYSELRYDPCRGTLVVGCLGTWGTLEGGVVAIDPASLQAATVITEAQIGGDISDALISPTGKGYAIVLEPVIWPDNFARLVEFDPADAAVVDTLYRQTSGQGSTLAAIEANRQYEIYLCDRDLMQPGIRIYDTVSDTLIARIDVGVPPFDLEFVQAPSAGTYPDPQSDGAAACLLMQNFPNPFATFTSVTYRVPPEAAARHLWLGIYDPPGRLVRVLADRRHSEGTYTAHWDGTDSRGRPAAPGVYFCTLRWSRGVEARRLVLSR
jgi:hypothetical protein